MAVNITSAFPKTQTHDSMVVNCSIAHQQFCLVNEQSLLTLLAIAMDLVAVKLNSYHMLVWRIDLKFQCFFEESSYYEDLVRC